jgi:hypothetical protein
MLRRIVAVLLLALWRRASRDTPAGLTLPALPAQAVERVTMTRGADTVLLVRTGDGWQVNGQPADGRLVEQFLAASDSTPGSELVSQSAVSHRRLGLDSASALRLTVGGDGRETLDLLVGSRGPNFEGFYVRRAGEDAAYLLRGSFVEATTRGAEDWRDRRILAVAAERIGSVSVRRGTERFSLTRSGTGWRVDRVAADSAGAARYVAAFGDVRASGFPDPSQLAAISFEAPELEVVIRGIDGAELARLAFAPAEAGFWVGTAAGVVYRVDSATGNRLAPPRGALLPPR